MVILSKKFRSALPDELVRAKMRERSARFSVLPGLRQKYYTHEASSGEWCGIYLWDSHAAIEAFLASELAKGIATAYEVLGTPRVEILEVHFALREIDAQHV